MGVFQSKIGFAATAQPRNRLNARRTTAAGEGGMNLSKHRIAPRKPWIPRTHIPDGRYFSRKSPRWCRAGEGAWRGAIHSHFANPLQERVASLLFGFSREIDVDFR